MPKVIRYANQMASGEEFASRILLVNEMLAAALESPFREAGLNFGTFELLAAVRASKGKSSQRQLSSRLGIQPASLCEAVQIASKKGLVTQIPSGTDRRVKNVALTPKGEIAIKHAAKAFAKLGKEIESKFSQNELEAAIAFLEKAESILDQEDHTETE